jgi:hypothetical protein
VNLYNHIHIEVEKQWEKLNIPLHASICAYTKILSYIMATSTKVPSGGVKRKPHQDPEVQVGYMQALDKLVPDEECDTIQQQLSHYISGNHAFGTNHAIRD